MQTFQTLIILSVLDVILVRSPAPIVNFGRGVKILVMSLKTECGSSVGVKSIKEDCNMSEAAPCPECGGNPCEAGDGTGCETCGGDGWVED